MSHRDQISQIWTQAIAQAPTGVDLARNESFANFRAQRSRLFSSLKAAMVPIQLASDPASAGAQTTFPPAAVIFGAVKYLLDAARGISTQYDAIVELMRTLKDLTVRLGVYAEHRISAPLSERLTEILATMLEFFAIARHQIDRGRIRAFGENLLLGNNDGKAAILDKLYPSWMRSEALLGPKLSRQ
ncbi:uncharacterized protein BDV17DRAFT_293077 [Aspergillus undulatus]|uniref:uncharacterized protein n=1 Tax=Aspergillus undulatus TaxID=1810928 RepID=UPI003CCD2B15